MGVEPERPPLTKPHPNEMSDFKGVACARGGAWKYVLTEKLPHSRYTEE